MKTSDRLKSMTAALAVCLTLMAGCKGSGLAEKIDGDFVPRLDTSATVTLNIVGNNEDLPAIIELIKDFNQYYPNCSIGYEYLEKYEKNLPKRLLSNDNADIFMTYASYIEDDETVLMHTADLTDVINTADYNSGIAKQLSVYNEITGKDEILCAPLGMNCYGLVVNETLLKKEGLKFPEDLEKFTEVCGKLKEKGYTPIQGSNDVVYYYLTRSLIFADVLNDRNGQLDMYKIKDKADDFGEVIRPELEELEYFIDRGFISEEINEVHDGDYSLALENFLKGDIPFVVSSAAAMGSIENYENTVKEYVDSPFKYDFCAFPMRSDGSFVYIEPWQGLAINSESPNIDYAKEFVRFASRIDELNEFTSIKGMPSASADPCDTEKYRFLEESCKNMLITKGSVDVADDFDAALKAAVTEFGKGELTIDEAVEKFENKINGC